MSAQLVQFQCWRLDPSFHALESNERLVAKQAFLTAWESFQSRALLVSWSLTGLRADGDILCLRAADSLELLQDMTCRVQSSGLGKFLGPTYSFLGINRGDRYAASGGFVPGQKRYLVFVPAVAAEAGAEKERAAAQSRLAETADRTGARLHPAVRGLDDADVLVAAETDQPDGAAAFLDELKALRGDGLSPAGPAFLGVLKDIRDIVDCLG